MANPYRQQQLRRAIGSGIYRIVRFVLLFGLCFIILQPFANKLLAAFMSPEDLLDVTVKNIPKEWSLYHWQIALKGLRIAESGLKTLLLATLAGVLQTFTSAMVGYGLARFRFRGRQLAMVLVIVIMLVPTQVTSISEFMYFRNLNMLNTPWMTVMLSLGTIGFKQGLYVYFFRAFFLGLPQDLENAAFIDGASVPRTFLEVILPNAKTVMSTVFLLSFSWQWTDVSFSKSFLDVYRPLPLMIQTINADSDLLVSTVVARNAAAILIICPLILLFLLCQKNLVRSFTQSGLAN